MRNVTTRIHVGHDGVLKLEIPTEMRETDLDVVIIYQPIAGMPAQADAHGWTPGFFERTAGRWQGESLSRESQGEYEQRDDLR